MLCLYKQIKNTSASRLFVAWLHLRELKESNMLIAVHPDLFLGHRC